MNQPNWVLPMLLTLVAYGCHASPRLMSWKDYSGDSHKWPYVLSLKMPQGALLYFGVRRTSDFRDPQLARLETLWDEFGPDVALNEGGDPPIGETRDGAIAQYGEAGLVRWLAARHGVSVSSMDLSRDLQAKTLRTSWPSDQIKMFFLLRALLPCERRSDCDLTLELGRILPIIASTTGITSPPNSAQEFAQALAEVSPTGVRSSDRADHAQWFDPTRDGHAFNRMARQIEDARDQQMIDVITLALQEGHRVFAVAGGSHVIRQEPVLRGLDKPRAKRRGGINQT